MFTIAGMVGLRFRPTEQVPCLFLTRRSLIFGVNRKHLATAHHANAACFQAAQSMRHRQLETPDPQLQDGQSVRVRILKSMAGVLDGVSLGHLVPGLTYDLDESLVGYLVSTRSAEAVPEAELPVSTNSDELLFEHLSRGVTITNRGHQPERAVGHDRPRRTRRKRG